jgi:hypothetical protein
MEEDRRQPFILDPALMPHGSYTDAYCETAFYFQGLQRIDFLWLLSFVWKNTTCPNVRFTST